MLKRFARDFSRIGRVMRQMQIKTDVNHPSSSGGRSSVKVGSVTGTHTLWYKLEMPSHVRCAHDLEEKILCQCQQLSYTDRDLFALKLAIEEAFANAVKHGNKLDPHKIVHVKYRITPRRVDVVIEDEGSGFNPASLPDPTSECNIEHTSGRGLLLMRAFMNNVVFNPSGNAVTLTKFNECPRRSTRRVAFG